MSYQSYYYNNIHLLELSSPNWCIGNCKEGWSPGVCSLESEPNKFSLNCGQPCMCVSYDKFKKIVKTLNIYNDAKINKPYIRNIGNHTYSLSTYLEVLVMRKRYKAGFYKYKY